jgi:hypothetical protein
MRTHSCPLTRRGFLRVGATSAALAAGSRWLGTAAADKPRTRKMLLSFYCDDTSPYTAGAKAFETFLDFCAERRIAGESSVILGMGGHSMSRNPNNEERAFLQQAKRAWDCGIDSHMEIMTHRGLFDFDANREAKDAVHEGLWLHEPDVTAEKYERYLLNIISEAERAGVRLTGLTWPGCGCEPCKKRYATLRGAGHSEPNPALWKVLLNLAQQGKFRGKTVPCFFGASETKFGIHQKAADGECAVFDLMPNAKDHFGSWTNKTDRANADYYLGADGKSGIIARHFAAGAPYCLWYAHWQGLNPAKGGGWRAFVTVVERIQQHFRDRVVWMRPGDITARYHAAGGWSFLDGMG